MTKPKTALHCFNERSSSLLAAIKREHRRLLTHLGACARVPICCVCLYLRLYVYNLILGVSKFKSFDALCNCSKVMRYDRIIIATEYYDLSNTIMYLFPQKYLYTAIRVIRAGKIDKSSNILGVTTGLCKNWWGWVPGTTY